MGMNKEKRGLFVLTIDRQALTELECALLFGEASAL